MKKQLLSTSIFLTALTVSYAQLPSVYPTNGLERFLGFDNNLTDLSGNNGEAVASNSQNLAFTADRFGNPNATINFDGTYWLEDADFVMNPTAFSISLWTSTDAITTNFATMVEAGESAFVRWSPAEQARVETGYQQEDESYLVWQAGFFSVPTPWVHFAMVYDGTSFSTFVNGLPFNPPQSSQNLINQAVGLFIGVGTNGLVPNPGLKALNGKLDEVAIYSRALTAQEISDIYNYTPPCTVNIPDANLKAALVGNSAVNTNQNAEIECDEASAYNGFLPLSSLEISDITGLEAFVNLTDVNLGFNNLTSVDFSANTALIGLNLNFNDIGGAVNFTAANSALQYLYMDGNDISSVDVSPLTNLIGLGLQLNELGALDLSGLNSLQNVAAEVNFISDLTLCTSCPSLNSINFEFNNISELDVSGYPNMNFVKLNNNFLTSLNVANGNNQVVGGFFLDVTNNPNLTCIQVDDATYSTVNWTLVDAQTSFNENCLTVGVDENIASEFKLFPNPTSGVLTFSEPISGELMDVTGKAVLGFSRANSIDLHEFNPGIYMLRTEGGTVHRVVRQ